LESLKEQFHAGSAGREKISLDEMVKRNSYWTWTAVIDTGEEETFLTFAERYHTDGYGVYREE